MPKGGSFMPFRTVTRRQQLRRIQMEARVNLRENGNNRGVIEREIVLAAHGEGEINEPTSDTEVMQSDHTEDGGGETGSDTMQSVENFYMDEEEAQSASESSSGSDDDGYGFDLGDFRQNLAEWAAEGVSRSKVNQLIKILRQHPDLQDLPADARTLLKTPRSIRVKEVGKGTYCHVGIRKNLINVLNCYPVVGHSGIINLQCNIDGLPLSKSSGSQVWPILMCLTDHSAISPFVVGMYHGYEKPQSCSEFLSDYVEEIIQLKEEGVEHDGNVIGVNVECYVCDAPARAFLAQIKSHSGYSSCGKCRVEGEYIKNRVVLNDFEAPLRTDESFLLKDDEDRHVGDSPLIKIPGTKMVTQFPYEYMHLVCLGVMRKMMVSWTNGALPVRLQSTQVALLNDKIKRISRHVPTEFARKPRVISELLRWKATEFRLFLLYTGPFLVNGIVCTAVFQHFLSLHYAVRILASHLCLENSSYARKLLEYVMKNYGRLYGEENISYNVHGLIHLTDDCLKFGPLDKFSAFKFENELQKIKKLVRKPNMVLPQIVRRLHEQSILKPIDISNLDLKLGNTKCSPTALPYGLKPPRYAELEWKSFKISDTSPNNCVIMTDGTIFVVSLIAMRNDELCFLGEKFEKVTNVYTVPSSSEMVGIYTGSNLGQPQLFPISKVRSKVMMIPISEDLNEGFYLAELLR